MRPTTSSSAPSGRGAGNVRVPSLGRQGGGWVVLQFALLALVGLAALLDDRLGSWAGVGGSLVALTGGFLILAAWRSLGRATTPFPRPNRAGLVDRGVYLHVRHPMYGGAVLLAVGWSIALAPVGLIPTALLAVVFDLKSRREEAWLEEAYPGYEAYRKRVRRRLVPGVY